MYRQVILKVFSVNHKGDIEVSFDGIHGYFLRLSDVQNWFSPNFGKDYHKEHKIERGTIIECDGFDDNLYIINPRIVGYKTKEG